MGWSLASAWPMLGRLPLVGLYGDVGGTLLTAAGSAGICLLLVLAGLIQSGTETGMKRGSWMILLNVLIPPILFALVFLKADPIPLLQSTRFDVVLAQAAMFAPFLYLPVMQAAAATSPCLFDRALALGCPKNKIFRRVLLPEVRPALAAGLTLVIIESMKELTVTQLLQPFGYQALTLRIFTFTNLRLFREASVWFVCLGVLCLYPIWVISDVLDSGGRGD
jgi:iron(III) transport system permease protein